jgi:hypothetical protein
MKVLLACKVPGASALPAYMRRLLTGHAISYNRRHSRHIRPPRLDIVVPENRSKLKDLCYRCVPFKSLPF